MAEGGARRRSAPLAALLGLALAACAGPRSSQPDTRAAASAPACQGPQENRMTNEVVTIRETTQQTISKHLVGAGNIWERDLPDDKGAVAPRMSATLSIKSLDTNESRHEKVFAGSVIPLGADRYCVEKVEEGKSGPGLVVLRKL